jgi:hypothetical protein
MFDLIKIMTVLSMLVGLSACGTYGYNVGIDTPIGGVHSGVGVRVGPTPPPNYLGN